MKTLSHLLPVFLLTSLTQAATVYSIDINDADTSNTAAGWVGLDATHTGNGGSVIVGGVSFSILSSDGARDRGGANGALFEDFAFDDGAGEAIILTFGGAGDLAAGDWLVEVWSFDSDFAVGDQFLGYRTNGSETIVANNITGSSTGPAGSFTFSSDGASAYDVFLRENNAANNTRINAVRLTMVPEPTSTSLLALGAFSLLLRRNKK